MSRAFSSETSTDRLQYCTILRQYTDQGDTIAQYHYDLCLQNGKGVSIDLRSAAHYFKLSADQGKVDDQCY
jgi:TPR repeat protein